MEAALAGLTAELNLTAPPFEEYNPKDYKNGGYDPTDYSTLDEYARVVIPPTLPPATIAANLAMSDTDIHAHDAYDPDAAGAADATDAVDATDAADSIDIAETPSPLSVGITTLVVAIVASFVVGAISVVAFLRFCGRGPLAPPGTATFVEMQ